jgi:WD40 repeat protein
MDMLKVASGTVVWGSAIKLTVWDGTRTYSLRLDILDQLNQNPLWEEMRHFFTRPYFSVTSFVISPNGQCIVWNANGLTGYPDDRNNKAFYDSKYVTNIVFVSRIGSQDQKEVFRQTYRVDELGSDNEEEKRLLTWSKIKPSTLYQTTHFDHQLYSGFNGIDAINFISGNKETVSDAIEESLAFSPDEKKIAYTPNDETCCAGSNYTNNAVIIKDIVSNKNITVYDEWKEFGNEKSEQEYTPFKASFSPSGSLLAISIVGDKRLATIRKTEGSGTLISLNDRFVIGWLDENRIILGSMGATNDPQSNKVQDIFIYDIQSGKEESLSLKGVRYIAFE